MPLQHAARQEHAFLIAAAVVTIVAGVALAVLGLFALRAFRHVLEKTSRDELSCRNCQSKSIRSSFTHGLVDHLFGMFGCVPFRCDVCSYRFYMRRPTPSMNPTSPLH